MKTFDEMDRAELSSRFPYARIDTPVQIGPNVRLWRAHIMKLTRIGADCTIGDGAHLGPNVTIGRGCKIQNGAQLFEGVTLEQDVFIGPHVVFTNVLNPRAFINRKAEFKPTVVKRGASIGANATILCGVTIGEYAMIGAGSVVTHDVRRHALVYGSPADQRGAVCVCGVRLDFIRGDQRGGIPADCTACGQGYRYDPADGQLYTHGEPRAKAHP